MGKGYGLGRGFGRGVGYGKGSFSGYSCVKFVFFSFNVIFWLLGCAVLGIGIWLQVSKGAYASISPSWNFISATVLCISAGVLILVIGFFGCCGAIMDNQCMLITYFVLVVVIFLLEIVSSILAFVYRNNIEEIVKTELLDGIKKSYPKDGTNEQEGLIKGWENIQSKLRCCGVNNYTDWYRINAWPQEEQVPLDCCLNTTGCTTRNKPSDWHQRGCYSELKNILLDNFLVVGAVGITVVTIQILGMAAAMAMVCCLRADKYEDY